MQSLLRVWGFEAPLSHLETSGYSGLKAGMQQAVLEELKKQKIIRGQVTRPQEKYFTL